MTDVEPPILQHDKNRRKSIITLQRGKWRGRTFHADLSCCPDPVCQCSQVTLACSPAEIDDPGADEKVSVVLDFMDRVLVECSGGGKIDPARLAAEIEEEATAEDWLLLKSLFIDTKRKEMQKFDPAAARVQLPPDLLWNLSRMAAYVEFFPYEAPMEFSHGETQWMVNDQYCINPDCGCTDGVLLFVPYDAHIDKEHIPQHTPYPAVFFDAKKGQATSVAAAGTGSHSAMELADAFLKERPDCAGLIRRRRETLRTLIKHNLPPRKSPFKQQKKTGRNAPCPCGSGKKYKNCCGG